MIFSQCTWSLPTENKKIRLGICLERQLALITVLSEFRLLHCSTFRMLYEKNYANHLKKKSINIWFFFVCLGSNANEIVFRGHSCEDFKEKRSVISFYSTSNIKENSLLIQKLKKHIPKILKLWTNYSEVVIERDKTQIWFWIKSYLIDSNQNSLFCKIFFKIFFQQKS